MRLMALAKSLEEAGHHVVHMEVGEPDFATPQPILDAAQRYLQQGHVHYTTASGLHALRRKIAEFYQLRYQVNLSPDRILITPGASGALMVALAALLDVGDEVLLTDPGYPCNANLIRLVGAEPKSVAVTTETNFQFTRALVESNWSEHTRAVLMASPSNPTGSVISGEDFGLVAEAVRKRDGALISDEIYHGLVYDTVATTALKFDPGAWVVNSFSKYFGMTGWRLGWLVVPEGMHAAAERLIQNYFISAPTHSQYAALAAFEPEAIEILERRKEIFRSRRDILANGLKLLGFELAAQPEGAFYIYADCSRFTDDTEAMALDILNRVHVAITPGLDFGTTQPERYLRFAYTTDTDELQQGLDRLATYLQQL